MKIAITSKLLQRGALALISDIKSCMFIWINFKLIFAAINIIHVFKIIEEEERFHQDKLQATYTFIDLNKAADIHFESF